MEREGEGARGREVHLSALNFNNTAAELLVLRVNIYKKIHPVNLLRNPFFPPRNDARKCFRNLV